jgi:hypothetical protein
VRAEAGFVAAQLLLATPGAAVLLALGLIDARPRRVVAAIGPSYLTGIAVVMPLLVLALVVGLPFRALTVVAICAATTGATLLLARRCRTDLTVSNRFLSGRERLAVGAAALGLAGWAIWVGARFAHLAIHLDDARIWSLKSYALFHFDHLEQHVFLGAPYVLAHPEYPILQPLLHATAFRFAGTASSQADHLAIWLVIVAAFWTIGWALARPGRGAAWLLPLIAVACAPQIVSNVAIGYADLTCASLLAAGALMVARWVEDPRVSWIAVGALLLAAAANVKNEGLAGALAVLVASGAVCAASHTLRPAWRSWLAGAALTVALIAPWRVWLALHHVPNSDQPAFHVIANPAYVAARAGRGEQATTYVLAQLTGNWPRTVPVLLAVATAALIANRLRRVAVFWLATTVTVSFTIVFAYWTSRLPLSFHVESVDRTISGTVLIAACGLGTLRQVYFGKLGSMIRNAFRPSPRRSRSSVFIGSKPVRSRIRSRR